MQNNNQPTSSNIIATNATPPPAPRATIRIENYGSTTTDSVYIEWITDNAAGIEAQVNGEAKSAQANGENLFRNLQPGTNAQVRARVRNTADVWSGWVSRNIRVLSLPPEEITTTTGR